MCRSSYSQIHLRRRDESVADGIDKWIFEDIADGINQEIIQDIACGASKVIT